MTEPDVAKTAKGALRISLLQVIAEYRQLSDIHPFNGIAAIRRVETAELAGAIASSYLNELGGLLATW